MGPAHVCNFPLLVIISIPCLPAQRTGQTMSIHLDVLESTNSPSMSSLVVGYEHMHTSEGGCENHLLHADEARR